MEEQIQENQTNQPDLEQTPVAIPEKKSNTLLIAILLVVILLIPAGVYAGMQISKKQTPTPIVSQPTVVPTVFVQPTIVPTSIPDETANWKIYTNKEYNFTIKYPLDAKLRVSQPESNDRMLVVAFDSPNAVIDRLFKSGGYSFEISMQTQKNFNTIDEYLLFQKEHNTYEEVLPKTYNNVKGYTFKNDKGYSGLNFTYRGYVAKNNDLYYTINYFTDESVDMFDQILSTFKFTE